MGAGVRRRRTQASREAHHDGRNEDDGRAAGQRPGREVVVNTKNADGSIYAETPAYVHSDGTAMVPWDCTGSYNDYSDSYADGAVVPGSNWLDIRTGEPGLVVDGVPVLGPFKRGFSYGSVR